MTERLSLDSSNCLMASEQIQIPFFDVDLAGIVWHAAIDFWAPILLSDSSLAAGREGTHLPTVASNLYLTVLAVQVLVAFILVIATKGKLGWIKE